MSTSFFIRRLVMGGLSAAALMIGSIGASLYAIDISGTYKSGDDGKIVERTYVIKKVEADKYLVSTNDWESTVYYDKQEDIYKGVFRFKDFPSKEGNEFTRGGSKENAVGFHLYKVMEDGSIKLTFQWGRAARDGQGTYRLVKTR